MSRRPWLIVGDSITEGMYDVLTDNPDRRIYAMSSVGASYRSWLDSGIYAATVEDVRPDLVVIALGTNPDGPTPVRFAEDVADAVGIAKGAGAKVILVGPFASDPTGERLAIMQRFAPTISGYDLAAGIPRTADGVHFTTTGYRLLAERMVPAVKKASGFSMPVWAWGLGAAFLVLAVGSLAFRSPERKWKGR
jgi:lysophospholipase L1-like esterase